MCIMFINSYICLYIHTSIKAKGTYGEDYAYMLNASPLALVTCSLSVHGATVLHSTELLFP